MTKLIARRPDIDGVFAASDLMAAGAMRALRDVGPQRARRRRRGRLRRRADRLAHAADDDHDPPAARRDGRRRGRAAPAPDRRAATARRPSRSSARPRSSSALQPEPRGFYTRAGGRKFAPRISKEADDGHGRDSCGCGQKRARSELRRRADRAGRSNLRRGARALQRDDRQAPGGDRALREPGGCRGRDRLCALTRPAARSPGRRSQRRRPRERRRRCRRGSLAAQLGVGRCRTRGPFASAAGPPGAEVDTATHSARACRSVRRHLDDRRRRADARRRHRAPDAGVRPDDRQPSLGPRSRWPTVSR